MDPMVDDWDKNAVPWGYSDFCKLMHSLDIAVHPFPLAEDID